MDFTQLKETLSQISISEESRQKIIQILDVAATRGHLTPEEKEDILGILDLEIELANLEADAYDKVALAFTALDAQLELSQQMADEELESLADNLNQDLTQFKDATPPAPQEPQVESTQAPQQPAVESVQPNEAPQQPPAESLQTPPQDPPQEPTDSQS